MAERSAEFTVSVIGPDHRPVGVGMVIGPRRVVTSGTVVDAALGRRRTEGQPDGAVEVRFPRLGGDRDSSRWTARVVRWVPSADFAGLELDADLPPGAAPGVLTDGAVVADAEALVFGYPSDASQAAGVLVRVMVRGEVQYPLIQVTVEPQARIEAGFAGSPAFDPRTGKVTGLLVAPAVTDEPAVRYLLSPRRIRELWPESASGPGPTSSAAVKLLHLSDLCIGSAREPQRGLTEDIGHQIERSGISPDLVVVSGDLTATGRWAEFTAAFRWLRELAGKLGIPSSDIVIAAGECDVSRPYRDNGYVQERILGRTPQMPYGYKWVPLAQAFDEFSRGTGRPPFDVAHPWGLHLLPRLRTVVAVLNSTMALSHRDDEQYGSVMAAQTDELARRLRPFREEGWLRLGTVHHHPAGLEDADTTLRDAGHLVDAFDRTDGDSELLSLILHGHATSGRIQRLARGILLLGAGGRDRRYHLIRIDPAGLDVHTRCYDDQQGEFDDDGDERYAHDFPVSAVDDAGTGTNGADRRPMLWERVRTASQWRNPAAVLDEIGPASDLLIREAGVPPGQVVVRALDGPVTREVIDDLAARVRTAALASGAPPMRATVVHAGPPAAEAVAAHARVLQVELRTLAEYQQVMDLAEPVRRQSRWLEATAVRYVPQGLHRRELEGAPPRPDDAVAEIAGWLTTDAAQLVYLYGAAGVGKSTLLREVAGRLTRRATGAVPLVIQLAGADVRTTSVERLLVQHLLDNGLRSIEMDKIDYLRSEGRLVLLLDGFDQFRASAGPAAAEALLRSVRDATQRRAKTVLAVRSLPPLPKPRPEVGTVERLVRLEPFSAEAVRQYLQQYSPENPGEVEERLSVLEENTHLDAAARSPRILAILARLSLPRLRAVAGARGEARWTLYRRLADAWAEAQTGDFRLDEATSRAVEAARAAAGSDEPVSDPIEDWLVAGAAAAGLRSHDDTLLRTVELTPQMCELLIDIVGADATRAWSAGQPATGIGMRNATALGQTLVRLADRSTVPSVTSEPPDLRDANLSGTTLRDVDLSGARLQNARLRRVRMLGGSLRGAQLAGSDWRGAALIGVADVPDERELESAGVLGRDDLTMQAVIGGMVNCLAVGHQSGLLAVGRGDVVEIIEIIEINEAEVMRTVRQLVGHTSTVRGVAFQGPGDRDVISVSEDRTMRRWDLHTGRAQPPVKAHLAVVTAAAVNADSIVTASTDGTVRIWGRHDRKVGDLVRQHRSEVLAVAVSPDGERAVTASADKTATLWDLTARAQLARLDHGDVVTGVAFAHDGGHFATVAANGEAIIWTAAGLQRAFLPVGGSLTSVAFSPDDQVVAIGRRDGTVWVWRLPTNAPQATLTGHTDRVTAVAFVPGRRPEDATRLVTCAQDGTVRRWDHESGKLLQTLDSDTYWASGLAFIRQPAGLCLAASTWDGAVDVWHLEDGQMPTVLGEYVGALSGLALSPDGRLIAAGQLLDPPVTYVWGLPDGATEFTLDGHEDGVTSVAFSPDGTAIATASEDHSIALWDAKTGRLEHRLPLPRDPVSGLTFRPLTAAYPDTVLAVCGGRVVRLWDPRTRAFLRTGTLQHERAVTDAVFLHSGDRIVTATREGFAFLWDLRDQPSFTRLKDHEGAVNCVAVSPDDTLIATGSSDNTVRIFETWNGQCREVLTGHAGGLTALAFAPNGRLLATAARDNTVRLWEVGSWSHLATLHVLRGRASVAVRVTDGAYRVNGDPGSGWWWRLGQGRFSTAEIRRYAAGPVPLAEHEPLIPRNLLG